MRKDISTGFDYILDNIDSLSLQFIDSEGKVVDATNMNYLTEVAIHRNYLDNPKLDLEGNLHI